MNELIETLVANDVIMKIWSENNSRVIVEFIQYKKGHKVAQHKVIQFSTDDVCLSNKKTTKMLQEELDEFLEFGV